MAASDWSTWKIENSTGTFMPIIRMIFLIALLSCPAASWSAEPQQTTATYRDWTLRCVVAADKHKKCEVTQATHMQGRQRPVSQIAISEPAKGSPSKMVVQLPIGVWLPAGVKVSYGANESAVIASFKLLRAGCVLRRSDSYRRAA